MRSQWINRLSAWIAPKFVRVSIKHILPSERSQSSSHQENYWPLKPWHTSPHSRTTLSTCKSNWTSGKHLKRLTFQLDQIPCSFCILHTECGNRRSGGIEDFQSIRHCSVSWKLWITVMRLTLRNRNFEISLLSSSITYGGVAGLPAQLQIYLLIERSMATKVFVVVVAIMNCECLETSCNFRHTVCSVVCPGLTAIVFVTICAATMVYPNPEIYSEMFVVPLGALFAFSSIRSNLPGAPVGFGEVFSKIFELCPHTKRH